jgi:hypothetical protein
MAYFWIGAAIVPVVLLSAAFIVCLAFNDLEEADRW